MYLCCGWNMFAVSLFVYDSASSRPTPAQLFVRWQKVVKNIKKDRRPLKSWRQDTKVDFETFVRQTFAIGTAKVGRDCTKDAHVSDVTISRSNRWLGPPFGRIPDVFLFWIEHWLFPYTQKNICLVSGFFADRAAPSVESGAIWSLNWRLMTWFGAISTRINSTRCSGSNCAVSMTQSGAGCSLDDATLTPNLASGAPAKTQQLFISYALTCQVLLRDAECSRITQPTARGRDVIAFCAVKIWRLL